MVLCCRCGHRSRYGRVVSVSSSENVCCSSAFTLTVAMICMILAEERLRKDEEEKEMFVYPPSKKIRMNYGKTSRQKWVEFLETQTYGQVQSTDSHQTAHTHDTYPEKTRNTDLRHETDTDERGSG